MKTLFCWSCKKIRSGDKEIKTIDNGYGKPFDTCKWCGKDLVLITDDISRRYEQ